MIYKTICLQPKIHVYLWVCWPLTNEILQLEIWKFKGIDCRDTWGSLSDVPITLKPSTIKIADFLSDTFKVAKNRGLRISGRNYTQKRIRPKHGYISVAAPTTIIREDNFTDKKHCYLKAVYLVMHTQIYIAAPSTHSLFMSHFPRMYWTAICA